MVSVTAGETGAAVVRPLVAVDEVGTEVEPAVVDWELVSMELLLALELLAAALLEELVDELLELEEPDEEVLDEQAAASMLRPSTSPVPARAVEERFIAFPFRKVQRSLSARGREGARRWPILLFRNRLLSRRPSRSVLIAKPFLRGSIRRVNMSQLPPKTRRTPHVTLARSTWAPDNGASRAVALEVLIHGPISRSEIARRLELSQGSLTRLSAPLIESGLLVETDGVGGRADRRIRPLDVVPRSKHFVGLKLTGTQVLGALTDLRSQIRNFDRVELTSTDPDAVADTMAALTERLGDGVEAVTAVGVGLGGLVANSSLVVRAPFLEWENVPLARMLCDRLGVPTVIENDVLAFTESEHWFGAGRGLNRFAVLTLGAGIGYGVVINGKIVAGPDSGIGLVGHWPLDANGPVCKDGHRGCAAAVLSTEGVERSVSSALGQRLSYDQCLDLAEANDPAARRVIDDAGRGLGRLIAAVANLTVPERIILAGEGVRLAEVASKAMQEGVARDRDPLTTPLDIHINRADEREWCRGGGVIAIQTYVLGLHAEPVLH